MLKKLATLRAQPSSFMFNFSLSLYHSINTNKLYMSSTTISQNDAAKKLKLFLYVRRSLSAISLSFVFFRSFFLLIRSTSLSKITKKKSSLLTFRFSLPNSNSQLRNMHSIHKTGVSHSFSNRGW